MRRVSIWIGVGVVILAALVAACAQQYRSQKTTREAVFGDVDALPLQISLADTKEERAQFAQALKKWKDPFHPRALYQEWMNKIGANGVIETLQTLSPSCHDIAHDLGREIYKRVGDVGTSLRVCADACNSGCMHGVLMEFFVKDTSEKPGNATTTAVGGEKKDEDDDSDHVTLADIKEKMTTICGSASTTGNAVMAANYKQGDCVHGVGHALMFLSNYTIPRALEYCKMFDTPILAYYCATGAYMEYVTTHDASDAAQHSEDPFYPCDQTEYSSACFRYKMAHVVPRVYQTGAKLDQLEVGCLSLQGKTQIGCFHGIGNGHFMPVAQGRMTLAEVCHNGSHDDQYACTEGLIERLGRYLPQTAKKQCETVSGWQKKLCEDDVTHELYDLNKPFSLYLP